MKDIPKENLIQNLRDLQLVEITNNFPKETKSTETIKDQMQNFEQDIDSQRLITSDIQTERAFYSPNENQRIMPGTVFASKKDQPVSLRKNPRKK